MRTERSSESLSQTNELSTNASPPLSLILPPGRTDRPTQPVSKETSACCNQMTELCNQLQNRCAGAAIGTILHITVKFKPRLSRSEVFLFPKHAHPVYQVTGHYTRVTPRPQLCLLAQRERESSHPSASPQKKRSAHTRALFFPPSGVTSPLTETTPSL